MSGIRRCESIETCQPHNITDPTWEVEGIKGDGEKPEIVGTKKGNCIILAGAANVWADLEKAKMLVSEYDLICVNDIGQFCGEFVYAIITAHPEWARGWIDWRTSMSHASYRQNSEMIPINRPLILSDEKHEMVNYCFSGVGNQVGTSGMLACLIALTLGYNKIILCGMPLDPSMPHFFSPYITPWCPIVENLIVKSWEYARDRLPTFRDKIRSCSGRTMDWIGKPSVEWICA
jgi:hypothetical protein